MGLCSFRTSKHQHILIVHFFFLFGQFQEFLVEFVQFFLVGHIHPIDVQAVFQCCTTRPCRQHNTVVVNPHILWVDDPVGLHALQHAILMDAAAVCKGI